MDTIRKIYASSYAAVVSIIVTTVVTVAAEISAGFKAFLKSFTGHHWTTKSWLSIIVFVLFYIILHTIFRNPTPQQTRRALVVLEVIFVVACLLLFGFFLFEYFEK